MTCTFCLFKDTKPVAHYIIINKLRKEYKIETTKNLVDIFSNCKIICFKY